METDGIAMTSDVIILEIINCTDCSGEAVSDGIQDID